MNPMLCSLSSKLFCNLNTYIKNDALICTLAYGGAFCFADFLHIYVATNNVVFCSHILFAKFFDPSIYSNYMTSWLLFFASFLTSLLPQPTFALIPIILPNIKFHEHKNLHFESERGLPYSGYVYKNNKIFIEKICKLFKIS